MKWWEDNIKEWTGMDFASSTRAAAERDITKSFLVPLQSYGIEKNRIEVGNKGCFS